MATLYEIDERIKALVDEETGEIRDFEAFYALGMELSDKRENIAMWIKDLLAEAQMYKAEIQSLERRKSLAEHKADNLKKYLAANLNGEKFKTSKVECSFRKSESVNVTDISAIPEIYLKYSEPTADKTAIKAAIKEGKEIAGAELVTKNNLQIK